MAEPLKQRLLILDDEERMTSLLKRSLEREGYEVEAFTNPEQAVEALKTHRFQVLLTDLRMPGMNGLEILQRCKQISPETEVILMTAFASVETAREALKLGAVDYLLKPVSAEEDLKPLLRRLLASPSSDDYPILPQSYITDRTPTAEQLADFEKGKGLGILESKSPAMRKIFEKIDKIARSEAAVLLRGESGTGKEVTADLIQRKSSRAKKPFLKINCGALTETLLESELFGHVKGSFTGALNDRMGVFASANEGTLLLDEIGEISPALQVKLLRVLQSGEYSRVGESKSQRCNVRVIAATNRNLEAMIETGEFRQDLYYRLNVVPVHLPPLRERREDLPAFIQYFTDKYAPPHVDPRKVRFSPEALSALEAYHWPGNVRELENAIEHALVLGDPENIILDDLPVALQRGVSPESPSRMIQHMGESSLEEIEKRCLLSALQKTGGNQTRAARILGVTRRTLGYRIKKYGLEDELSNISGRD
ncbi:MAG: sigma-54 dependent transcriptional regulator [Candidatus Sumerlaeia bacterium]|nr:sigma-54 dependent transcriptional regulator [Candidatus Sumerlaeia bacterium]